MPGIGWPWGSTRRTPNKPCIYCPGPPMLKDSEPKMEIVRFGFGLPTPAKAAQETRTPSIIVASRIISPLQKSTSEPGFLAARSAPMDVTRSHRIDASHIVPPHSSTLPISLARTFFVPVAAIKLVEPLVQHRERKADHCGDHYPAHDPFRNVEKRKHLRLDLHDQPCRAGVEDCGTMPVAALQFGKNVYGDAAACAPAPIRSSSTR